MTVSLTNNQYLPMSNYATLSEVGRIAAMHEPVQRNLQITQSYHELSLAVSKQLGPCANWCTFATWASRQAGQTIRGEDLAKALQEHLSDVPALNDAIYDIAGRMLERGARLEKHRIAQLVWETTDPKAAMLRASAAVAKGNLKVFAEIAREFARFVETCLHDPVYDEQKIARFCAALKPGDPPDGQRYLRQAFTHYYKALFEKDAKTKAEYILTANLECGFHEQTRLQPEITEAMEASVIDPKLFKERLLRSLFPRHEWVLAIGPVFKGLFNRATPLEVAIGQFAEEARLRIRLFLTANMMELGFPKGIHLHLGKDLKAHFPSALQKLTYPELLALLKIIDPTADSLVGTGAVDWANLYDRLHFIGDLFRCYQDTADLLGPPFET